MSLPSELCEQQTMTRVNWQSCRKRQQTWLFRSHCLCLLSSFLTIALCSSNLILCDITLASSNGSSLTLSSSSSSSSSPSSSQSSSPTSSVAVPKRPRDLTEIVPDHEHAHDKSQSEDLAPLQPANNEQPFATFVYSALVNDKVQLPCDISPPTGDDQLLLVLWYKDEQLAPILTLDGRKNQLDQPAVISSSTLQGRAYFNVHGQPAHLLIDPLAASDEGDYRCRVDFRKGRTVNTVISLKVIVPPLVPKIVDGDGNQLTGLVGPYNEGDELVLTCTSKAGRPRPSLIWWRDYAIIDDSFEFDDRDVTSNELTIARLARHHLLAILMCQAINSNITTPVSNSITLDMNLKPTEVRITQLTPVLVAGSDALFECNTYGSRPMPLIYWTFEGRRIDARTQGEQQTTSTITVRIERRHRQATLECVVQNVRIPAAVMRDQMTLDVQYLPQLDLKLGAPSLSLDSVQEGIDIYFDCHIDSNPPPTTPITWLFNGEPLQPEPGVIESNQSLVLQRVQRWRNGTYQCRSTNQHGTVISNQIRLQIKFAPVCRTPFTLLYGLNLNEIVPIPCEVEAIPEQVSFQWRFERSITLANFVQVNASRSVLEYFPQTRENYGLIECTAKNEIGIQRDPCRYLIVPAAGPYFPYNCGVANQSDSSVSIRCDGTIANSNATTAPEPDLLKQVGAETPKRSRPATTKDDDDDDNDDTDDDDDDEERDDADEPLMRPKVKTGPRRQLETSSFWSNLTTSDIYALYFAPDDEHDPSDRLSYRSEGGESVGTGGGLLPMASSGGENVLELSRLESSASLLLNELVARFNSHSLVDHPPLFVHPPTNYICEIYALAPRPTLIKNVTIDAVGRRIMNPFNGSFSFLVEDLPANTPMRVNIYARNNRKRSPLSIELDTRTLVGNGNGGGRMSSMKGKQSDTTARGGEDKEDGAEGSAKGRKSAAGSFFEELYGGYGRFRSKHLVVGLIIGTVAITIFVAILLIIIVTVRSKESQTSHNSRSRRRASSNGEVIELESRGSGEGLTLARNGKNSLEKVSPSLTLKRKLKSSLMKENTLTRNDEVDESLAESAAAMTASTLDALVGDASGGGNGNVVAIGTNGYAGLDGDDDNSMRSDHQLISQGSSYQQLPPSHHHHHHHQQQQQQLPQHAAGGKHAQPNFYQTLVSGYKPRSTNSSVPQPPPSYYDLDTSAAALALGTSGAYLNLYTTTPSAGDMIKPDLLQHATHVYQSGGAAGEEGNKQLINFSTGGTVFDTMSFATNTTAGMAGPELIDQGAMLLAGEQLSANLHLSPMRKYSSAVPKSSSTSQPQYSLLSFNSGSAYASLTRNAHQVQPSALLLQQEMGNTPASYIYIQQAEGNTHDHGSGLGQTS